MKNVTIINRFGGSENVGLVCCFEIAEISKKFVAISRNEVLPKGQDKIYISEFIEESENKRLVGITDASIWEKVKFAMGEIVHDRAKAKDFDVNNAVEQGYYLIGLPHGNVEKLENAPKESEFTVVEEQPKIEEGMLKEQTIEKIEETPVLEPVATAEEEKVVNVFENPANQDVNIALTSQFYEQEVKNENVEKAKIIDFPKQEEVASEPVNIFDNVNSNVQQESVELKEEVATINPVAVEITNINKEEPAMDMPVANENTNINENDPMIDHLESALKLAKSKQEKINLLEQRINVLEKENSDLKQKLNTLSNLPNNEGGRQETPVNEQGVQKVLTPQGNIAA